MRCTSSSCVNGLVCDEPFSVKSCIVSVCHHQDGDSALNMAAREGWAEVVSLLLEAGASTDLQNKVVSCMRGCGDSTV